MKVFLDVLANTLLFKTWKVVLQLGCLITLKIVKNAYYTLCEKFYNSENLSLIQIPFKGLICVKN